MLKELLKDRTKAESIGREGKNAVMDRFNLQRFTQNWEQLFLQVIATSRPREKVLVDF